MNGKMTDRISLKNEVKVEGNHNEHGIDISLFLPIK